MTSNEQPQREERVLDASALKALSHPLRLEIYDLLSQYGAQTASSLAEHVGESSGVTSYHLRELAKHDLIREVPGHGTARERWWERPRGAVAMGSPEASVTPAGKLATSIVIEEFYRRRHEQLIAFLRETADVKDDDELTALLTTSTAALTDAQFFEMAEAVSNVISEYVEKYRDQTGDGVRRFAIRADIFPLPAFDSSEHS
ncbi:helix-turn-helix domain-containing protein [Microbacterium sp. NC79]|uniref:winged helix-turn-helix domain-containing protein n=1 Tax=Microbacterium sp. NC79 TaxID=2851009 RepID=UPI001C2C1585|nr:helix-turn-helix domain-containing protein [Microbacterium sp. NC79]MBV0894760.1 helix-turn-helix domain-containing protein [Microbacterium sp. NC79]